MRCSGRASELSCSACWAAPRGCAVDSGPRTAPMRGSSGLSSAWCGSWWRAGFWPAVLRRVLDGERRNDMSKPPDVGDAAPGDACVRAVREPTLAPARQREVPLDAGVVEIVADAGHRHPSGPGEAEIAAAG